MNSTNKKAAFLKKCAARKSELARMDEINARLEQMASRIEAMEAQIALMIEQFDTLLQKETKHSCCDSFIGDYGICRRVRHSLKLREIGRCIMLSCGSTDFRLGRLIVSVVSESLHPPPVLR